MNLHCRSARAESLFIDCSTIDQNTVNDIVEKTSQLGGNYIDSPVSGGKTLYTYMHTLICRATRR